MAKCTCNVNAPAWAGRDVFVLITGATRGFGACIAEQIVHVMCSDDKTCPQSISLFLIGRNHDNLVKTKELTESVPRKCKTQLNVIVNECMLLDFSTANEQKMEQCIDIVAEHANKFESNNELHLLFNNIGTLGMIDKKAHELGDISSLDHYTRTNFTSMVTFTSIYLQKIKPKVHDSLFEHRLVCVLNISSLAGVVPFQHMSEYCSIKAARAMFMRCLAVDRDDISSFNYSPGPLKTDMFQQLKNMVDEDAAKIFKEMELQDRILDPNLSARECISWLGFLSTPCGAKQGNLCHQHHADIMGIFTGNQLDYFDARDLPNPFRIPLVD